MDHIGTRANIPFNGGVFLAERIAARLVEVVSAWGGPPIVGLPHADLDLAVAPGAVAYALARRGHGVRIGGGAARGYYVGLEDEARFTSQPTHPAPPPKPRRAICVVPRRAEEGAPQVAAGRSLARVVGCPVRLDLFASDEA